MKIKTAEFTISNTDYKKCPKPNMPEYAFIGRSNVGKSSLINMLTGRNKLAKTSGKPGKTQLINHFLINQEWYLVDLPGYGWAQVSKKLKSEWGDMIADYITKRENLQIVFVLIDCRLDPQKIDLQFINWLGGEGIPLALVFTKGDKLSRNQLESNIARYKKTLLEYWEELPVLFKTSAENKMGQGDLLNYIQEINQASKK